MSMRAAPQPAPLGDGDNPDLLRGGIGQDTEVVLANGHVVKVQDLKVGDELMGFDGTARRIYAIESSEEPVYEVKLTWIGRRPLEVSAGQVLPLRLSRFENISDDRPTDFDDLASKTSVGGIKPDPNGGNAHREPGTNRFIYSNEDDLKAGAIAHILSLPRTQQAENRLKNKLLDQQGISQRTKHSFLFRRTIDKVLHLKLFSWSGKHVAPTASTAFDDPNGDWLTETCADEDDAMAKLAEFKDRMGFARTGKIDIPALRKELDKGTKKSGSHGVAVGGIPSLWARYDKHGRFCLRYAHIRDVNAGSGKSGSAASTSTSKEDSSLLDENDEHDELEELDGRQEAGGEKSKKSMKSKQAAAVTDDDDSDSAKSPAQYGEDGKKIKYIKTGKKRTGRPPTRTKEVRRTTNEYAYVLDKSLPSPHPKKRMRTTGSGTASNATPGPSRSGDGDAFLHAARQVGAGIRSTVPSSDTFSSVSVADFLNLDEKEQKRWYLYVPDEVSFGFGPDDDEQYSKTLPVDPYFLGLWLGDGTEASTDITNNHEEEIIDFLERYAATLDMKLSKPKTRNRFNYRIVSKTGLERQTRSRSVISSSDGDADDNSLEAWAPSRSMPKPPAVKNEAPSKILNPDNDSDSDPVVLPKKRKARTRFIMPDSDSEEYSAPATPALDQQVALSADEDTSGGPSTPQVEQGPMQSEDEELHPLDKWAFVGEDDPLAHMTAAERAAVAPLPTPSPKHSQNAQPEAEDLDPQALLLKRDHELGAFVNDLGAFAGFAHDGDEGNPEGAAAAGLGALLEDDEELEIVLDGINNFQHLEAPELDDERALEVLNEALGDDPPAETDSQASLKEEPLFELAHQRRRGRINTLLDRLRILKLTPQIGEPKLAAGRKHIPTMYLRAPASVREKVAAGLIDSDGSYSHNQQYYLRHFIFSQVKGHHSQLFSDTCTLFRSLGCTSSGPFIVQPKAFHYGGRLYVKREQHLTGFSGPIERIPTLLPRKQVPPRRILERGDSKAFRFKIKKRSRKSLFYKLTVSSGDGKVLRGDFLVLQVKVEETPQLL